MKEWFTAREIAELKLPGLPESERGIRKKADRETWEAREREASGGGREYPLSALPAEAREAYERPFRRREAAQQVAVRKEEAKRQIATIAPTSLTARQRAVMEARAAVLLEVERRMMAEGIGVMAAIRSVVADSRGGTLSPEIEAVVVIANDRSGGKATLCERSIRGWRSVRDDSGLHALAPQITREKNPTPPWLRSFLIYWQRPTEPTIARALENWRRNAPNIELPSYQTVRRELKKMTGLDKARGREGPQALKARQAYTARDTSDLLPTSVYLADGKTFGSEVQHPIHGQPFKPEITTVIDAYARRIVGISVALSETALAVADALRVACCQAGIPAIFYTDRGPGYVNEAMDAPLTGYLARLGITPMRALPYNSQAKGIVERVNHEWSHLARNYQSYGGRDMDREAAKAYHQQSRRELKTIGVSHRMPSWDQFIQDCLEAVEHYNNRHHSSLPKISDPETGKWRHMSPNEMWQSACDQGFEPILVSEREADDLFRPWVERVTRRGIVEMFSNQYFADELEPYDRQKVIVGYDIQDATRVWVRAIDEVYGERQPGRLIAVAKYAGNKTRYVPVTAEQDAMERRHAARLRRLQAKVDVVEQELRPAALLDAHRIQPMPEIAPAPVVIEAQAMPTPIRAPEPVAPGGRPRFADDTAFARWIVAHPEAATASDVLLIRDLITSHTMRNALRMSGVDLDALQALTRAAA